jgi:hypothetical protein
MRILSNRGAKIFASESNHFGLLVIGLIGSTGNVNKTPPEREPYTPPQHTYYWVRVVIGQENAWLVARQPVFFTSPQGFTALRSSCGKE